MKAFLFAVICTLLAISCLVAALDSTEVAQTLSDHSLGSLLPVKPNKAPHLPAHAFPKSYVARTSSLPEPPTHLQVLLDSSWTIESLRSWLCGNMSLQAHTALTISSLPQAGPLELPDCFYGLASSLRTINLDGIVLKGNLINPDPFVRLIKSLSTETLFFGLKTNSKAVTYNGEIAEINLEMLSRLMPKVTFQIEGLQKRSSAQAIPPLALRGDPSWSNDTFAFYLCGNITNTPTATDLRILPNSAKKLFLLPDCFYDKASVFVKIDAELLVVQGNSTFPDPLERLVSAISRTPERFHLGNSHLIMASGERATINWDAISILTTKVSSLSFSGTYLGPGATLPMLPRVIPELKLAGCGLSGNLPDPLFAASSAPSSLKIDISNNKFDGSLAGSLLDNLGVSNLIEMSFNARASGLSGTIPEALFGKSFPNLGYLYINLNENAFNGPLGDVLGGASINSALQTFSFTASLTDLEGPLPFWIAGMESLTTFSFFCDGCKQLRAQLPADFLPISKADIHIFVSLQDSRLTGDIPELFFRLPAPPSSLTVDLTGNQLVAIHPAMFDKSNFSRTYTIEIGLADNLLTGNLPTSAGYFGDRAYLSSYELRLDANPTLQGTVPPTFLESLVPASQVDTSSSVTLRASSTGLTGTLALPDFTLASALHLLVLAPASNFTSLTYPAEATSRLARLDVGSNSFLVGSLTPSFFLHNDKLDTLLAAFTLLNGQMPDMGSLNLQSLVNVDLSHTLIDFCNGNPSVWNSSTLEQCNLGETTAFYCDTYYPKCDVSMPPPSTMPSPPPMPTPSPPTPSPPIVVGCSNATRPPGNFTCINDVWTLVGSAADTVIVIPSGATTTTIKGNLTSSTVIINGLNSLLKVDGCTANVTIIIELTPEQLKTIGVDGQLQQLLLYSNDSSCNSSTSDITIDTRIKGSSCRKVSVSKESSSDGGTISGLFRVDKSGCDKWWIILISVICAVIVILAVFVLLVIFVRPIRECVRPYSKRSGTKASGNV